MIRALLLTTLLLSGCGSHAAPQAQVARPAAVGARSLGSDLLGKLGPYAARKAVKTGIALALRQDGKATAEWQSSVESQPEAAQTAFLQKRLSALHKAIFTANLALVPLSDVSAARAALDAVKAEDAKRGRSEDQGPAALLAWADALAGGLTAANDKL